MVMIEKKNYRAGFVALLGEPNAGKSTLLNAVLGEKVSIVTDKPQTTRSRVTGILNLDEAQVIFVDAPGTLKSKTGINNFLQDEVGDVVRKADVLCLLLASDTREETAIELIELAKRSRKPWVAVVTKSDLLGGTRTPKFFGTLMEEKIPFISISSLKRPEEAKAEVLTRVVPLLPEAPAPLFDEELYTTQTLRQMAAEFVREECFDALRQEIPYGLAVRVVEFKEEGNVVRIRCEIIVDKENHKGMVIGAKGQMLKAVGTAARKQIERVVGRQVFLELHVAVKENWTQNPRMMKELGYVVTKE
jgi:GTP-binding protein Era